MQPGSAGPYPILKRTTSWGTACPVFLGTMNRAVVITAEQVVAGEMAEAAVAAVDVEVAAAAAEAEGAVAVVAPRAAAAPEAVEDRVAARRRHTGFIRLQLQ